MASNEISKKKIENIRPQLPQKPVFEIPDLHPSLITFVSISLIKYAFNGTRD